MKRQQWGMVGIAAGLLLVALSFAWPLLFGSRIYWNAEQQQQFSQAAERLHGVTHQMDLAVARKAIQQQQALEQQMQTALEEFQEQEHHYLAAQASHRRTPRVLFWLGLAAAIAGVLAARP